MSRRDDAVSHPRVPVPLAIATAYAWRLLVLAIAVAVVVLVLVELRLVFLPVLAALFLTTLLSPLVLRLRRRGWKPALATTTVFIGTLIVLALLMALFVPQVASEVGDLGSRVKEGANQVLEYATKGPLNLSEEQVQGYIDRASEQLQENRDRIASGLVSAGVRVFEFLAGTLLTLVLLFFFLKDGRAMWAWFTGQFTEPVQTHVVAIGERLWATMASYLRGVAIIGAIEGTAAGIVLLIVGVPLVAPLVLLQFLAAFFPVVGPIVAGAVATLVALVTGGVGDAVVIAIAILAIQQLDNHLLQPVIMGRAVKLHPVVVLVVLTAGGVVGGVIGALLAVPAAAGASTIGHYINQHRAHETPSFGSLRKV